jgi:hypothetical protein
VGNEVRMIDKFVQYCRAQVPEHLRADVVPLLLALLGLGLGGIRANFIK